MKVAIIGDTHFGGSYSLGKIDQHRQLNSRLIDFSNTFDYVIDYLVNNDITHLILTGDIFESRRPAASELVVFSEKIYRLSEAGINTYIIVGNHDIVAEQKTTTVDAIKSLHLPYINIFSDIDTVSCEGEDAFNFIFFPFRTRQMLGCNSNEGSVNRLRNRLQYEINGIVNNYPKMLIGHFMLQGTILGNTVVENHAGEIVLPLSMFNEIDAVVMGHVHPHQIVCREPLIAYVGSMERKDFGEGLVDKFFLIVENTGKNLVFQFEKLPVRSLFDITFDLNAVESNIMENIYKSIESFGRKNVLFGSIIRLSVFTNEKMAQEINIDKINEYLKKNHNISYCVSIHIQLNSKRQLRKSTITERVDPIKSFNEYLELEDDLAMRENMREFGEKIIKERTR